MNPFCDFEYEAMEALEEIHTSLQPLAYRKYWFEVYYVGFIQGPRINLWGSWEPLYEDYLKYPEVYALVDGKTVALSGN